MAITVYSACLRINTNRLGYQTGKWMNGHVDNSKAFKSMRMLYHDCVHIWINYFKENCVSTETKSHSCVARRGKADFGFVSCRGETRS